MSFLKIIKKASAKSNDLLKEVSEFSEKHDLKGKAKNYSSKEFQDFLLE